MKTLPILLLLGSCLIIAACSKRAPSYESQFQDYIHISFSKGHPEIEVEPMRKKIDETLRASKTGYFSGVMIGDGEIDFISMDTDFDLVDEHALVARFIQDGTIPQDVKAEYEAGDDHENPDRKVH